MKPWLCKLLGAGAALTFSAATLVSAYAGYLKLFTFFGVWDDEGYLLLSLRSFLRGDALYDAVYSQYGPFYYLAMGGVFQTLGLTVTHDSGRLVSLALWLAASLGVGLIVYGLSNNLWLACGFQWVAFKVSLLNLAAEPMHPGGLLCLLLVALAATPLLGADRPHLTAALQGTLVAALALVKINVGAFAFLALLVVIVTERSYRGWHRLWTGLGVAAFVAAPTALLAANLGASWARHYAFLVTAGAVTVAISLLRTREEEGTGTARPHWLIVGGLVTGLGIMGLLLMRGTSLGALLRGVLIDPLRHAQAFTIPLELPLSSGKLALGSLVACGVVAGPWLDRWQNALRSVGGGVVRLAVGSLLAVTASGVFLPRALGFLWVAWAWIAVWKPYGLNDSTGLGSVRRLVPPLAVLQTLHAYPVAGSQVQWGAYLLVLVAGICVLDGARQLASVAPRRFIAPLTWWIARAAALALAVFVLRDIWAPLRHERLQLANTTRILFPGSRRLHLPYQEAEQLAWVVRELRANCSTFVSLPGLNSFYLWSEIEPPTSLNATAWMFLFDAEKQERIVQRIRPIPQLCMLRQEGLSQGWQRGRALPNGPLVDFLSRGFVRLKERGGYEIWRRPMEMEMEMETAAGESAP